MDTEGHLFLTANISVVKIEEGINIAQMAMNLGKKQQFLNVDEDDQNGSDDLEGDNFKI